MSRQNTVVLFTLSFPYGKGEAFLESELPVLLQSFQRVVIVPRDAVGTLRPIPDQVEVDASFSERIPSGLGMVFSVSKRLSWDKVIHRELRHNKQVRFHFKSLKLLIYYRIIRDVIKLWYETKHFDSHTIFYTYWLESFTYGLGSLKTEHPLTLVSRAHRYDLYEEPYNRPYFPFRKTMFDSIDQVFPISKHGEQYLHSKYALGEDKVTLSRLGVKDGRFTTLNSRDGVFRVVSCSSFMKQKRVDLILNSIAQMADRYDKPIEWTHIGDGEFRQEVQQLGERLLPDHVKWTFLGSIDNSSVIAYYQSNYVDVFVNLSSSEGLPVSMMEVLGCGIPIVATDVGGVDEIVNNHTGVLLDQNVLPQEVATQLLRFAPDSTPDLGLKASARAYWESAFRSDYNYEHFVSVLQSMISDQL
ncbi:glycosyltransferase [Reichenbachiella agarivorans]|uniref:Glycosyltransferase n=1 Tax=Reichenbachiella agarivorans TaxID=2979464 RepID=A0ABY6CKP6_9BACT|nr:glycosyltransferase [Reichenbachiella agarivorans]UXP31062.1 glycosyltransferase [Reichenbachiella agarivorans]